MRLEGTLDGFGLSDVMSLLAMTAKTGVLHVSRGPRETRSTAGDLWFTGGRLCAGEPDTSRAGLARRVAASLPVDEPALARAAQGVATGSGLLPTLLAAGAVDEDEAATVVTEHLVDTVFELMRWTDGEFTFTADQTSPESAASGLDVAEVLATVRERLARWEVVSEQLDRDAPLMPTASCFASGVLGSFERDLLTLLDGRRSAEDVAALSGRGRFTVLELLSSLRERGLVELAGPGSALAARRRRLEIVAALEGTGSITASAADTSDVAAAPTVPRQPLATELPASPDDVTGPTWFSAASPSLGGTPFLPAPVSGYEAPREPASGDATLVDLDSAVSKTLVIRLMAAS